VSGTEPPALDTRSALLTSRQMAEANRLTVASGIAGATLTENAGRPVALAIQQRRRGPDPRAGRQVARPLGVRIHAAR
jgi:NAD(P)H-hydrate repair Nnr-like enzyme with NAD(P)H-hydrate epimerase domain